MAGAVAFVLASCVGSVDQDEFNDEVRERGGGLSHDVIDDAVAMVAADQGIASVQLRSLSVMPGRVALEARVPGSIEDVDAYTYGTSGMFGGEGLDGPEPVHTSPVDPPLESAVFTTEQAGIERFDDLVDQAIAEADLPGGYATAATIDRPEGRGQPQVEVSVTNARRTVMVRFAADGTLVEVTR